MSRLLFSVVASFFMMSVSNANVPDDADVINVRVNCIEGAGTADENKVENCFQTMEDVNNWINFTRVSTNSLLVDIGPGTFGGVTCSTSDITFRGAGRDNTVIQSGGPAFSSQAGCDNLNVQDLKIESTGLHGVLVVNTQELDSTWTNVEISGVGYGWLESIRPCNGPERGSHRFFSSRINVSSALTTFQLARGYGANCSKTWLYGTEVTSIANDQFDNGYVLNAVNNSEIHVYGSNLRFLVSPELTVNKRISMIGAIDQSEIHIHGTGIDFIAPSAQRAYVLLAELGSSIHANSSAYAIQNPGTTTRIFGDGVIKAPYDWENSNTPPPIISVTGADVFVDTGKAIPEMFIYSESCNGTGGTWVSARTGLCRS